MDETSRSSFIVHRPCIFYLSGHAVSLVSCVILANKYIQDIIQYDFENRYSFVSDIMVSERQLVGQLPRTDGARQEHS